MLKISRNDLVYQLEDMAIILLMDGNKLIPPAHLLSSMLDQSIWQCGHICVDGANIIGCIPYKKFNFTDLLCRLYKGFP